jgi:hypothetical protein
MDKLWLKTQQDLKETVLCYAKDNLLIIKVPGEKI